MFCYCIHFWDMTLMRTSGNDVKPDITVILLFCNKTKCYFVTRHKRIIWFRSFTAHNYLHMSFSSSAVLAEKLQTLSTSQKYEILIYYFLPLSCWNSGSFTIDCTLTKLFLELHTIITGLCKKVNVFKYMLWKL